ncbi:MAG: protein kinase [Firmicutes bacterium]|nr:protein kinase [Bacillota bacterium]
MSELEKSYSKNGNNDETVFDSQAAGIFGRRDWESREKAVPVEWNAGDTILDAYDVVSILGEGGLGRVYQVYHKNWQLYLAVKSPRPETLAKSGGRDLFAREAETWANLGLHPHIVCCYYVRALGGIPRIFLEYIGGGSLAGWIRQRKLYGGGPEEALERILDIAVQFAWGLDYAHGQGVVHQDVKPANVLLTNNGLAKVTDFGLGMTPAYCSPEQALGEKLSRRTDIWSWGLSILEMFTGEAAWLSGVAAPEALEGYLRARPEDPALPAMPVRLAELLRRCFQVDPHARPAGMAEIAAELREIYREETGRVYWREEPAALNLRADSLNNKAVSLLDLGRETEARQCWEEALKLDPQHLEATFNLGRFQWWRNEITANEYLIMLKGLEAAQAGSPDYWRYLAAAVLDFGLVQEIERIQQSKNRVNDEELLKAIDRLQNYKPQAFLGHTGAVTSVCFSPDGRYLLSGSHDSAVRLWERESGKTLMVFQGHLGLVNSVCFSPDGRFAASGSNDKTVRLWDLQSGKAAKILQGHTGAVNAVCYSPDGDFVLSGAEDGTLRLWDRTSGKELKAFGSYPPFPSGIRAACFSPDGAYVLAGYSDGTITLWKVANGEEIAVFKERGSPIQAAVFSLDGHYALSGDMDGMIRRWRVDIGHEVKVFRGHDFTILSVAFSPDGRYALSGSEDCTLRLWEVATGRELKIFQWQAKVNTVCFSPDGRYALIGDARGGIWLWELAPVLERKILMKPYLARVTSFTALKKERDEAQTLFAMAVEYLDKGGCREAYSCLRKAQRIPGYKQEPILLNLVNQAVKKYPSRRAGLRNILTRQSFDGHSAPVNSVCFSPDGTKVLSAGSDKTLRLWEVKNGGLLKILKGHTHAVNSACFSPDGSCILSGSGDNTMIIWEAESGKKIKIMHGKGWPVIFACFSPDGRYILSGSSDKKLRLWDKADGKELKVFAGHENPLTALCFSPDGRFILSGSHGGCGGSIRLWETASGRSFKIFDAKDVHSLCFSPNGKYFLSGGTDDVYLGKNGIIRLWETSSGRELQVFKGHSLRVTSVCFSPDGRYILSGSADRSLRLWETASGLELETSLKHNAAINSVSFSPDGRYAVSGSANGAVSLLEFDWEWEFFDENTTTNLKIDGIIWRNNMLSKD